MAVKGASSKTTKQIRWEIPLKLHKKIVAYQKLVDVDNEGDELSLQTAGIQLLEKATADIKK